MPTTVSSDQLVLGDTGMPDTVDGDLLPSGTSDESVSEMTSSWSTTYPELIEKTLHNRKFFSPKFMLRLVTLGWFGASMWVYISDQIGGNLNTSSDLLFVFTKIGGLFGVTVVAGLLLWVFSDKTSDE